MAIKKKLTSKPPLDTVELVQAKSRSRGLKVSEESREPQLFTLLRRLSRKSRSPHQFI